MQSNNNDNKTVQTSNSSRIVQSDTKNDQVELTSQEIACVGKIMATKNFKIKKSRTMYVDSKILSMKVNQYNTTIDEGADTLLH